jgi:hypothetical protein
MKYFPSRLQSSPALSSRALCLALVACCASTPSACAAGHMAVPQDVSSVSEEIVVTDRSAMSGALVDESFKIGPYQVVEVNRKWNSSSTTTIAGFSSGSTTGGYAFGLKAPDAAYQGQCASQLDEKSTSLLGGVLGQQKFNVLCQCAGPTPASFTMNSDTISHYRGTVTAGSATYTIEGVYTDDKGSSRSEPTGYHVRGATPVGAVEVVGKGRVWLAKSLEPGARSDLTCLFAGLLLYKTPQGKMDK